MLLSLVLQTLWPVARVSSSVGYYRMRTCISSPWAQREWVGGEGDKEELKEDGSGECLLSSRRGGSAVRSVSGGDRGGCVPCSVLDAAQ
jgi:hypothetical protein